MMEYFKPLLMTRLEEQNKGRQIGWEVEFRRRSSEVGGQFSFGAKRLWSAMRPRIAFETRGREVFHSRALKPDL